jgi:hemoglobin
MRNIAILLVLTLGLAACGGKAPTTETTPPEGKKTALYFRLGEKPAIEAVVDKFIANVVADARINKFFTGLDAEAVAKFRNHLVDQVCAASGGPCEYTGKDMVTVHTGMNITEDQFNATVEDLVAALNELSVPKPEQDELLGVLGGLKDQIVGK